MNRIKEEKIILKGMAPLIQVYDMQTSIDFYCKKLDFTIKEISDPFDWAWLTFDDCDRMLNTL